METLPPAPPPAATTTSLIPMNYTLGPATLYMEVPLTARILTIVACCLSVLGSILIIITYVIWRDLRTMSRHLLLCLVFVDLLGALSFGYGTAENFWENSLECELQSTVSTFCQTSSFLWTLAIAVYLYITIVWVNVELANRLFVVYHVLSWGIPAVAISLVLAYNGLGWDNSNTTVGWCWVDLESEYAVIWMLLTGKLWEILACIILPVLCILMKLHIRKQHISGQSFESSYNNPQVVAIVSMDRRLTILPLMFVALRCWGIVRFVAYLVRSPLAGNWVLITLQGVTACSQGSANCFLYFLLAKNVRTRLFQTFKCRRTKTYPKPYLNLYAKPRFRPCAESCCCYTTCLCHCCQLEYVQINADNFYSDLAVESNPLLHSAGDDD